MQKIDVMLYLVENGALYNNIEITTGKIAKKLSISQQTISNELVKLEIFDLIRRIPSNRGIKISLTKKGREYLNNYKLRLNNMTKKPVEIIGRVFTGVGQGKFYVMQKNYLNSFKKLLDMEPFHGTLNLKVDKIERSIFLENIKPIKIEGFKTSNRTFGEMDGYKIKINKLQGAIIIPKRSHYKDDTIEIICKYNLREKLNLKDNEEVKITWD